MKNQSFLSCTRHNLLSVPSKTPQFVCQGTGIFAVLRKLNITDFIRCCLMKLLAFFHTGAVYFCQTLAGLLNITKWYLQVCSSPTDQVQRFLCIYLSTYYISIFFIIHNQKEKLMTNFHLPIIRHIAAVHKCNLILSLFSLMLREMG